MITVLIKLANEKIPKKFQVIDCDSSTEGGRGRPERIFGVCLTVKRIYPKSDPIWASGKVPLHRHIWVNDYGDITEVKYNGRIYDFKKEHDAELFYNAIKTELELEKL